MSAYLLGWAYRQKTGSPITKLVLLKLVDNANDNGFAHPPMDLLIAHTELSERSVRDHIKKLEDAGLLTVVRETVGKVNLPNKYQLNIQKKAPVMQDAPPDVASEVGTVPRQPPEGRGRELQTIPLRELPQENPQGNPSVVAAPPKEEEPQFSLSPVVIEFPTNKTGETFAIGQAFSDEMQKLYPAVDVAQQLRAMRAWLVTNEKRRKTKGGIPSFISGWLAREQNKGPRRGAVAFEDERMSSAMNGLNDFLGAHDGH